MGTNLIAVLIGLITSVAGGYLYTYLIEIKTPFVYAVGVICVVSALGSVLYIYRGKIFLLANSGIIGYYPEGQSQYARRAAFEVKNSQKVTVVGARGMDLTGENSPIGNAIKESKVLNQVEIYLLAPETEHSRLRSDHLDVERKKYAAECESVDSFIGVLKLHEGRPITKYTYIGYNLNRFSITAEDVLPLGLGTHGHGHAFGGISKDESLEIFDLICHNLPENSKILIDTAPRYGHGTVETWIGEFLASKRDRFLIATKGGRHITPERDNEKDFSEVVNFSILPASDLK